MSTRKIIFILLGFICAATAVGATYLYSKPENKYILQVYLRTRSLTAATQRLKEKQTCLTAENKPNCFNNFALTNGGIQFCSDFPMFATVAHVVCDGKNNKYCVFEALDPLINQLDIAKLWVAKNKDRPEKDYYDLYIMELDLLDKYFRNYRKSLVEYYDSEVDGAKKQNALNFIKLVDGKIQLLQRVKKDHA